LPGTAATFRLPQLYAQPRWQGGRRRAGGDQKNSGGSCRRREIVVASGNGALVTPFYKFSAHHARPAVFIDQE